MLSFRGFFFSSRRRHTRCSRDWSSDVCSSDLGEPEVRAWTIRKGATAVKAAGVIHSDIEKGFIRAEVVRWNDLLAAGGFGGARGEGQGRVGGGENNLEEEREEKPPNTRTRHNT